MQMITSSNELRAAIVALELAQGQAGATLKTEFYVAFYKIQPINIIKSTVKEAIQSPDLKEDLINASLGMALGFVSKSLFEGETHSPTRKLIGKALMSGVTFMVVKNPEFVKAIGNKFIDLFRSPSTEEEMEEPEDMDEKFHAEHLE